MTTIESGEYGISKLLAAEKDALNMINRARQARTEKLKQEKKNAKNEVENFIVINTNHFNLFRERHNEVIAAEQEEMRKKTQDKVEKTETEIERNSEEVIRMLLDMVVNVNV